MTVGGRENDLALAGTAKLAATPRHSFMAMEPGGAHLSGRGQAPVHSFIGRLKLTSWSWWIGGGEWRWSPSSPCQCLPPFSSSLPTFRGMLMAASRLDLQAKSDTSILFKELCSLCASLQSYEVPFNLAPVEPQPAQCFYEQSWQSSCCTCVASHSHSHSMCMCLCSANRSNAVFLLLFLIDSFWRR